jgi:hypothetical protein
MPFGLHASSVLPGAESLERGARNRPSTIVPAEVRQVRIALTAAVVCVLFGAGLAGGAVARPADPKLMVLRLNDLPVGFGRTSGHYASNIRAGKEGAPDVTAADYRRWGRITGYEAEYQKSALVGLLDVDSAASTYRSEAGAGQSLHATYRAAERSKKPKFVRLSMGRTIGNDSRLYSATVKQSGLTAIAYSIAWRWKTVKASVMGIGIAGTVQPETVIALARTEQRHIRAVVP